LDCLDSRDSHTLPAFFEIKNSNKYTIFDILYPNAYGRSVTPIR
jgi:hypothetical protein